MDKLPVGTRVSVTKDGKPNCLGTIIDHDPADPRIKEEWPSFGMHNNGTDKTNQWVWLDEGYGVRNQHSWQFGVHEYTVLEPEPTEEEIEEAINSIQHTKGSAMSTRPDLDQLALLKNIAHHGLPFRLDIIDDSSGTGRVYLDLIDTDDGDKPYRLELIGPDEL